MISAHIWTLWPVLRHVLQAPEPPPSKPWSTRFADPQVGDLTLTGRLHPGAEGAPLLILVHGLGGSVDSRYMVRTARFAARLGVSMLRLNLRGADRCGEDLYHGGLSEDLHHVLASPALAGFERIILLGFSLGGHIVLRFATQVEDPRVRAAAAACAPLDLAECAAALDRPGAWLYRRYILKSLVADYALLAQRSPSAAPIETIRRVRTFRDFDTHAVVPRFGFADADDYYYRASAARRIDRLRVPALLVAAKDDPMVPEASVRAGLAKASDLLDVRLLATGGHMGFPASLDLGETAPRGLEGQMLAWLLRQ